MAPKMSLLTFLMLACMACRYAPEPGSVGAPIWTESSSSIVVRTASFTEPWVGGQGMTIATCRSAPRAELTAAQSEYLEKIQLIPLDVGCTADGFSYLELEITDSNGTVSSFRDTGCDYLQLPGAKAMLAFDEVSAIRTWENLAECSI